MADSTLSNLTSLTLPSQATDLLLVGRGTARPNKVAMSDALNSAALAATTGAYGVVQLAASGGTTAGTVVQATDARLSDTRNPPDGSKGDIVVSGSGSTWTIKTNPTLSGTTSAGSINASGKVTAQGTTAFPYEGQLIASNSSPSGTNSAVSQAILQAQPGYQTYVGVTGDGTTASYRTGGLGNVVLFSQSYLVGDGANGMLLHSINGPTIFATQNTGSEKMRLASNGNLLLGKTSDNALGRLQVSGAITMEETAGTGLFGFFGGSTLVYGSLASNPVVIRTNNTAALTIDTSQNATLSGNTSLTGASKTLRIHNTTPAVANGATPINFTRVNSYSDNAVLGAIESVCFGTSTEAALVFKTSPVSSLAGGVTAFVLDPAQNARLYGNYFYIGGATSNFYIRNTGSDNGLLRGNFLSADFASGFLLRNDTGTVEYLRVENPSGAVLLGTATNSNNGRLQLADHTAATGGIGMGTDWSFFRLNTSILRFQTASVSPGLSLRHSTSGTELTLTASTASGNGIVNTVSCNNLVLGVNGGTALTLDNAQGATFAAALRTTAGGFRSTGSLTLGVAYATLGAGFQVSYDSPDTRIFYGDGTGYSLRFATRVSSTTTDRVVINDNGNVTINGNLTVTGTISPSGGGGSTNVWIPASQWIPRTTNGCGVDSTQTTTNLQNFDELLFDPATAEYAQALVRMPSNYNNGTVTARFFWSSSSSTGSVVWGLQARAFADDDALDTAFGTAQTVTDTLLATGDMHISAATSAVTSGGTPAATTPLQFQIYRDATNGSDTLGSDARLLGVEISFTSV